ncbi:MAG: hypothetical protein WCV92_03380 [Candidatus Buchananbacteria bacterium]
MQPNPQMPPGMLSSQNQPPEIPKSGHKGLIITLIIVIVILFLAIGAMAGYFVYESQKNNAFNQNPPVADNTTNTLPINQDQTPTTTDQNLQTALITWNEPQVIQSLNVFSPEAGSDGMIQFDPEKEAKYYKVGIINDGKYKGGEIIIVTAQINAPSMFSGFYRFVKMPTGLVVLKKYSTSIESESGLNKVSFTVDDSFLIPELDFPGTILGPDQHQTMQIYSYTNEFFSAGSLKKVFTDAKLGDVYTSAVYDSTNADLFKRNGFYIRAADGTVRVYSLKFDFIPEGGVPQIAWSDGKKNTVDYSFTDHTGCGSANFASVMPENIVSINSLKIAGTNSLGDSIYEFKDSNAKLLKEMYNTKYQVLDGGKKITYQAFIASHPMFFWKDSFGRLIKFESTKYGPIAECGKPVIYLYPEKAGQVSVKVEPKGGMSYSDPDYKNGWMVNAEPNGKIVEVSSGKTFPYLFWEGNGGIYEQPQKGFVIKKSQVHNFLIEKLAKLGLNKKETADFMEFWEPRMQSAPYYFVTFLGNADMERLAPLTVDPKPDTVVRILMDFSPLQKPIKVEGYSIRTPERKGFTVVEWGGVIR